jgi:hypothetical protein
MRNGKVRGALRWSLLRRSALSGGVIYLPLRTELCGLTRNGAMISATPWDARVGPAANALLQKDRIVAIANAQS